MSDTPRTDAEEQLMRVDCDDSCVEIYIYRDDEQIEGQIVAADFARQLERELNESKHLPHAWELQAMDRKITELEAELSSIYATSESKALAEANAANVNLLGLLEKSQAREAQLRAALDAPPHDPQHVECVCYGKNPAQVLVGYICNKCKALTLPAPPVVPVEDVKPLVEALQRFTNPTDEGPTLHSIISNALATFTAKHEI